ncbi:hypothetical protein CBS101457_000223 [Exobasidium rhododendri]|nr:hypothetical protein CBS101457_000223 [Exobasidium rhododendri]
MTLIVATPVPVPAPMDHDDPHPHNYPNFPKLGNVNTRGSRGRTNPLEPQSARYGHHPNVAAQTGAQSVRAGGSRVDTRRSHRHQGRTGESSSSAAAQQQTNFGNPYGQYQGSSSPSFYPDAGDSQYDLSSLTPDQSSDAFGTPMPFHLHNPLLQDAWSGQQAYNPYVDLGMSSTFPYPHLLDQNQAADPPYSSDYNQQHWQTAVSSFDSGQTYVGASSSFNC